MHDCAVERLQPTKDSAQVALDILSFIQTVSERLHASRSESEVYRSVIEACSQAALFDLSILTLTNDERALRVAYTSLPLELQQTMLELVQRLNPSSHHAAGCSVNTRHPGASASMPLTGLKFSLKMPAICQVATTGVTVHASARDTLCGLLSRESADAIIRSLGCEHWWVVLTPIRRRSRITGALLASTADSSPHWVDAIKLLGLQISDALERIDEQADLQALQQELQRREAHYRVLSESSSECRLLVDRDGVVFHTNPATERQLGYSSHELDGMSLFDLLTAEEVPRARAAFARLVRSPQTTVSGDMYFQPRGHASRVCQVTVTNLLDDAMVAAIVVNAYDITERRQAEEAWRASEERFVSMAKAVPVAFWMITPDSKHALYVSPAIEDICGLTSETLRQRPSLWFQGIHDQDRDRVVAHWQQHHEHPFEITYRFVRSDGQVRWVQQVNAPVCNQAGELTVLTGILQDITERKQTETQMLQAAKLASLGLMAGGIAHELRNPLAIILTNAELLAQCSNDALLCQECARRIHAAVQRSSHIIENLLNFATPRSEHMTQVDLGAIFEDTLTLVHDHLALQGIRLHKDVPPDLPRVHGNAHLLQTVFTNLVLNACNAMPYGGTLQVSMRADDGAGVQIAFCDNGHGIALENLPNIFDPFMTSVPDGKGTALGLAVSHAIIQQHQGSIKVSSQIDKGSTFTIRLPIASTSA